MCMSGAEEARPQVRRGRANSELRNVAPEKDDLKESVLGRLQQILSHLKSEIRKIVWKRGGFTITAKDDNKLPKITFGIISCAVLT